MMQYDTPRRCTGCGAPIAYAGFRLCMSCHAALLRAEREWAEQQPTEPLPVVWSDEEQRRQAFARYLVTTGRLSEGA